LNLLLADGREAQERLVEATVELQALRASHEDVEALRRLQERQQAAYLEQHATLHRYAVTATRPHRKPGRRAGSHGESWTRAVARVRRPA
jgi:hypothetical protein